MEAYNDLNFSKFRIIKNVTVLCIVFFILFTAYDCFGMLQSTLNHEEGIGVAAQSVVYASFCFSSILFPTYFIQKLGSKRTLSLAMCLYVPYIASNLYPHWSFMMPAAVVNGLGGGLLWGSQCSYLNELAILYVKNTKKEKNSCVKQATSVQMIPHISVTHCDKNCDDKPDPINIFSCAKNHVSDLGTTYLSSNTSNYTKSVEIYNATDISFPYITEESVILATVPQKSEVSRKTDISAVPRTRIDSVTARFFGILGMSYLSTHMWSNVMSYFVLQTDVADSNITFNTSCVCGAGYCNEESDCFKHNLLEPSTKTRNFLTWLCIALSISSILLLVLCLDSLNDKKEKVEFSLKMLMATYRQSKKKLQILLVPVSYYVGMTQGSYMGVFTASYIGCAWGTYHVSLVTICYGAACGVSSTLSGLLVKRFGRIPIFLLAGLITIASQVLLLIWSPTSENPTMFFIIASLWGASLGTLWSQTKAIHGLIFKEDKEAAFAAYHVWYALGFSISYAYSNLLCTYVQIYLLVFVIILGMVGYLCAEFIMRREIK